MCMHSKESQINNSTKYQVHYQLKGLPYKNKHYGPKQVQWFQDFLVTIVPMKQRNFSDKWQLEQFKIIPVKYWNGFVSIFLLSFCCWFVNTSRKYLPDDSRNDNYSKRLELFWLLSAWFLCFIGTIITRNSWNHRTCLGP